MRAPTCMINPGAGRHHEREVVFAFLHDKTLLESLAVSENGPMALSARNQLTGRVEELKIGTIMAHVVVRVGENQIESVITRTSAEELKLKVGDTVKVVVKSTEVMIQKD